MNLRRINQQIRAILETNGLRWTQHEDDYALRFSSALVLVGLSRMGEQVLITLRAPVLQDLKLDADSEGALLRELNLRNCASHFGKWAFFDDAHEVGLEYDLLGDHLQEEEFMTALT